MAGNGRSTPEQSENSLNPIKGLGLRNFRSIEEADVEIKPLTIVVGGNSAGKSSVLSALRLLKQAQESNETSHVFPLEGIEIELGQFGDLRRQSCVGDEVVEIAIRHLVQIAPFRRIRRRVLDEGRKEEAQTRLLLGEVDSAPGLAQLQELEVRLFDGDKNVEYLSMAISDTAKNFPRMLDGGPESFRVNQRRFSIDLGRDDWFAESVAAFPLIGRLTNVETGDEIETFCRLTTGGIPQHLEVSSTPAEVLFSAIRRIRKRGVASVIDELDDRRSRGRIQAPQVKDPGQALLLDTIDPIRLYRTVCRGLFSEIAEEIIFSQRSPQAVSEQLQLFDEVSQLEKLKGFDAAWVRPAGFRVQALQETKIPAALFELGFVLRTQLSHLGPLRQGPRRLYAYGERASANELGREAQYFAYSLRSQKDLKVNPFREDRPPSHREALTEALSYWARRLDVAESVDVHEEAGYGRKVRIMMKGLNKPLDWEKVGVGVSQILPVLLKVLTSRAGTVTLIEQPELHLHPDAQAALADFLIAAARNERHLIIETHSDALLTRIRTRVAEEALQGESSIPDLVTFVYASRDDRTGISSLRNVDLTETGSFDDWPTGFADQTAREARQLLLQQSLLAEKRASQRALD